MSYTKQTWQTGEVITADKLNHMEDGIGSCVMVVSATTDADNRITLGSTWQEIHDAIASGKIVVALENNDSNSRMDLIVGATIMGSDYHVYSVGAVEDSEGETVYITSSADGYPVRGIEA